MGRLFLLSFTVAYTFTRSSSRHSSDNREFSGKWLKVNNEANSIARGSLSHYRVLCLEDTRQLAAASLNDTYMSTCILQLPYFVMEYLSWHSAFPSFATYQRKHSCALHSSTAVSQLILRIGSVTGASERSLKHLSKVGGCMYLEAAACPSVFCFSLSLPETDQ